MNEVAPTGVDWPGAGERLERLREAVSLIHELWTGDQVHFEGQWYQHRRRRHLRPPAAADPDLDRRRRAEGRALRRRRGRPDHDVGQAARALRRPAAAERRRRAPTEAGVDPDGIERMIEIKLSYAADRATAVADCRFWAPLALPGGGQAGRRRPARARAPGRRARRRAGRLALHLHRRPRRGGGAHRPLPRARLQPPRLPQPGDRPARLPRALRVRAGPAPARPLALRSGFPRDRGYDPARAAPLAYRRRDSALRPDLRRRPAGCAGRRGRRRRLAVDVGSLLPERRREDPTGPNFECMTVLGRSPARPPGEPRRARRLQRLPQRRSPRRHGAHDRPRERRALRARDRGRLVRARLPRVRLRRSAPRAIAPRRSPRRSRACATGWASSPRPGARPPAAARRGRRRARPAAPRRRVRGPLELLRHARRAGAQERHPRRALREHRARSGRDRAYGAARGRRGDPRRRLPQGWHDTPDRDPLCAALRRRRSSSDCAPGATGRRHDDADRHHAVGERGARLRRGGGPSLAELCERARERCARAARDVLAQGLHPAHAPLPRRLPLLHVRAAAAARRALLHDARRGARDRRRRAARPAVTRRSSRSATSPSCATAPRARSSSGWASRPRRRTWRTAPGSCCARRASCRTPTRASSTTTSCSRCARSAPRRGSCSRRRASACRSAARRTSARPTSCPRCASTRSTAPGAWRSRTRAAS